MSSFPHSLSQYQWELIIAVHQLSLLVAENMNMEDTVNIQTKIVSVIILMEHGGILCCYIWRHGNHVHIKTKSLWAQMFLPSPISIDNERIDIMSISALKLSKIKNVIFGLLEHSHVFYNICQRKLKKNIFSSIHC